MLRVMKNHFEKYMLFVGTAGQILFYAQGFKIFYTKEATGVSLLGFSLGLLSVASWLLYGLFLKNRVLIVSNLFAVIGALLVICGILLYS